MANQSALRRYAIPLAALVPAATIAFAFALGPSPRKVAANYFTAEGTPEARRALLDAAGPKVIPAIAERIVESGLPHRAEAIAYLEQSHDPRAMAALEKLLGDDRADPELRKAAFEAVVEIDRRRGLAVAEGLSARTDDLGAAARRLLADSDA